MHHYSFCRTGSCHTHLVSRKRDATAHTKVAGESTSFTHKKISCPHWFLETRKDNVSFHYKQSCSRMHNVWNLLTDINVSSIGIGNLSFRISSVSDWTSENSPGCWFLVLWNIPTRSFTYTQILIQNINVETDQLYMYI